MVNRADLSKSVGGEDGETPTGRKVGITIIAQAMKKRTIGVREFPMGV
jgi:hypothetical protein